MVSIVLVSTPFKVGNMIVFLVTILVIDTRQIEGVWNKKFSDDPVNPDYYLPTAIESKGYTLIPIFIVTLFKIKSSLHSVSRIDPFN